MKAKRLPSSIRLARRHLLAHAGFGLGAAALAQLFRERLAEAQGMTGLHHPARARRVIFLCMSGAPSQLDLFDPKPALTRHDGQEVPAELVKGERFAFIRGTPKLLGSPYAFARHGQSGAAVSELLPHTARIVDDITIVKSMHTTQFNHGPGTLMLTTGHQLPGRPSVGAWLGYGIGSESDSLPGFVALNSGDAGAGEGSPSLGSGFLPTRFQGVRLNPTGDPVLFLSNPQGVSRTLRRRSLDALQGLNRARLEVVGDPEIETRIAAAEMAYRMQTSVPELAALDDEPESIKTLYGYQPGKASFANNCLLARRLIERGVRFVQLTHGGWDTHGVSHRDDLMTRLPQLCRETDQGAAALITDLKQRGLLDDTLVVWAGEFGRTPMNEGRHKSVFLGRDHHPHAFTIWMAGGGVKRGFSLGSTDDLGYRAADDRMDIHDLHATMLHLLGVDHKRLTFRFQGRDFRLTDVEGRVIDKLFA